MAMLFLDRSTCSICGEVLATGQPIVGWLAFLPREDELYRYSDSGMHRDCFESWEHHDAFLHKYRIAIGEIREEPQPPMTRIAIIGVPEEREDLLRDLRQT